MNGWKFLLAWCVALVLTSDSEARKWTDTSGNQVSADYVRIHEGEVILRQGTRLLRCPYDQFCELDKAYIREQMEAERNSKKRRTGLNQIGGPVAPEVTDGDAGELRTWRDVQGNKVLAQYAGFSVGRVELLKDGQRVSYPYGAFSRSDQEYVAQILIAEGRGDELPKSEQEGESESSPNEPGSSGWELDGGESSSMDGGYSSPEANYSEEGSTHGNNDGGYESGGSMESESEHDAESRSPDYYDDSSSSGSSMFPQPQMVIKKKCMKCNGIVPDDTKVGDRCPHCGVTFGYEVGIDGKRTGAGASWRIGFMIVRLGILGFVVLLVLTAVMSRR